MNRPSHWNVFQIVIWFIIIVVIWLVLTISDIWLWARALNRSDHAWCDTGLHGRLHRLPRISPEEQRGTPSASALGYAKPDTFKGLFLYLRSSQAKVNKTLAFAGSPVPILGNFISELTMTWIDWVNVLVTNLSELIKNRKMWFSVSDGDGDVSM